MATKASVLRMLWFPISTEVVFVVVRSFPTGDSSHARLIQLVLRTKLCEAGNCYFFALGCSYRKNGSKALTNRRSDWFWKLAHELTNQFDVLCFEALNLKGMQRLWGRKISDLAFGEFLKILEWIATKKGKQVIFIDRWYPSSKTCSHCGYVLKELDLSVREWRCPSCKSVNGRDENAAINIQRVGASTFKLGDVRQAMPAIAV